ncbi:MAG: hypothetical protein OXI17_01480 [Gammaproteobacteria bacterium]|nr:hypothetical protein [Gammaproteobacteria bacterium]
MEDLVFEILDVLEVFGPFFSAVIGGLIVTIVGPILSNVRELYFERSRHNRRKAERRRKFLTQNSDNKRYKKLIRKWMMGEVIASTVWLCILVGFLVLLVVVNNGLKGQIREFRISELGMVDDFLDSMYASTVRQPTSELCSDSELELNDDPASCIQALEQEIAINRQQLKCNLLAYVESKRMQSIELERMAIARASYQACMLDEGWYTTDCVSTEENCVEILYASSPCTSMIREWLETGRGNSVIEYCERRFEGG